MPAIIKCQSEPTWCFAELGFCYFNRTKLDPAVWTATGDTYKKKCGVCGTVYQFSSKPTKQDGAKVKWGKSSWYGFHGGKKP